jgi:hypothetical protein
VLAWLGMDERPERPFPAESLHVAKHQLDALERWVRQKVKEDWTPPKTSEPEEAKVSNAKSGRRCKRADFPDQYEVNLLVHKYLSQNPQARIRQVVESLGFSVGTVQKTEAWRLKQKRRRAEKPPQIKERQLTPKMQASIANEDNIDDVDERIDRREATWRWIIEEATPTERARLNAMPNNDKEALIDHKDAQDAEVEQQEKRRRWGRRECS